MNFHYNLTLPLEYEDIDNILFLLLSLNPQKANAHLINGNAAILNT
jgi:hypothetical protein